MSIPQEEKENMSNRKLVSTHMLIGLLIFLAGAITLVAGEGQSTESSQSNDARAAAKKSGNSTPTPAPTPIGAWFGIARPCIAPAVGVPIGSIDPFPDATICGLAGVKSSNDRNVFPLLEVTMIPTLLADGTVLADDFAETIDHHTTAQGKWESGGQVLVDGKALDKYQATFVWFSGPLGPPFNDPVNPAFIGSIRPRFVTFFDADRPDQMRGFIQPYLYRYTTASPEGIGVVKLGKLATPPFVTPFPDPNPTDPLPTTCNPSDLTANPRCLGTLHFYIRRIPAK
jgi:hypothetical protein